MSILENFSQSPIYQQFFDHLKKKYPEEYDTFTATEIQDKFDFSLSRTYKSFSHTQVNRSSM